MIQPMEVSFKRDLYHNFMVISGAEYNNMEAYCTKMLAYQQIEGILPLENQIINNQSYFNYDITAKQSVHNLFEKTVLSMDQLRNIFITLIDTIERAFEYLLVPDDFLLLPEYIYLDIDTNLPFLCYLPGYQQNIKNQMSKLIEYIMNKVDYNDKEAVLLVYRLYAVSKEEGYTFNHLKKTIQNIVSTRNDSKELSPKVNESLEHSGEKREGEVGYDDLQRNGLKEIKKDRANEDECSNKYANYNKKINNNTNHSNKKKFSTSCFNIPVMMEKLVGEQEVSCYPLKTYLLSGILILGGILLLLLSYRFKIIYNSFGNRIDYSKLFAVFLILVCLEGYSLKRIWDKKHRITRLVAKCEYVDPRENFEEKEETLNHSLSEEECVLFDGDCGLSDKNSEGKWIIEKGILDENEAYNPTCLLSELPKEASYLLVPLDKVQYETIQINEMPFFIGKIKRNVDYCLENDLVSRYHAKITKEDNRFYLTDLNSTNGTFLNGKALQPYDRKEIKIGDEITLANIRFIFTEG